MATGIVGVGIGAGSGSELEGSEVLLVLQELFNIINKLNK
tara:strand:- start:12146 stop:12265 length:120 start_codon:yes stop_codon:yes gene_type:complete